MTDKNHTNAKPQLDNEAIVWGSDLIADAIRSLGFKYVTLNPGSSFRGLHDSLVNHLGNRDPEMVLCLHEEHAVSIAHGWAKVTGQAMAVILHANVGLMHASMAIYNAWCDRVPMVIFGATGPVAADKRRPWIDWIHTSRDQASIVRSYVKFDDQPASLKSSLASIMRAHSVANTAPRGPTYVCFDVSVQEEPAPQHVVMPDPKKYSKPEEQTIKSDVLATINTLIGQSKRIVFLMGRVSRNAEDWAWRVTLAESCSASVITDIKTGATFPTTHAAHVGPPSFFLSNEQKEVLASADLILAFDWIDVAGALDQSGATGTLINISIDHQLANGWSFDHFAQAPAEINVAVQPDIVIKELALTRKLSCADLPMEQPLRRVKLAIDGHKPLTMENFPHALEVGLANRLTCLVRLPLGWDGSSRDFTHPLDYLGYDGGAGIGSGPGMLIGAALALKEGDRLPVAVLGDGDTMMGISALWTGVRYQVPFLLVVCNNRSYFNDEVHQEKVAVMRDRPIENKSIGQEITDPDIDFAALARAQGLIGLGPVNTVNELVTALEDAKVMLDEGRAVLIDARVNPEYSETMVQGMTETGS
jgi:thiamine pyrophosphate-dependent acetolactate synthase large subunit-like protein